MFVHSGNENLATTMCSSELNKIAKHFALDCDISAND